MASPFNRSITMTYDKSEAAEATQSRDVGNADEYEAFLLASRHKLTLDQARELINRFGNDRATLDKIAKKLIT